MERALRPLDLGMTARELLHRVPAALVPGPLADEGVIQFDISEPVYHVIKAGTVEVHDGVAAAPDVTVRISDDNLLRLLRGDLNAMTAFMTGKLKVQGNMLLAQSLVSQVDREKLASYS